jgi:hypothetical protein
MKCVGRFIWGIKHVTHVREMINLRRCAVDGKERGYVGDLSVHVNIIPNVPVPTMNRI